MPMLGRFVAAFSSSLASSVCHHHPSLVTMARALSTETCKDPCTRVLFCGSHFPAAFEFTKEHLRSHPNIEVDALEHKDVPSEIERYDICVVRMMCIDSSVIARAKRLKLLVQFGVGLEGVDVKSATEAGIKVARIPSNGTGNALSCAEHAIYLILALLRDQVLIIGFGNIGRELATRLKPFGVYILATKRSWNFDAPINGMKGSEDLVDEKGSNEVLLEFASRADIVVTCCHLTPETAGMINSTFLAALRKGALLVNIARGGVLDYGAVKASLEMNHLGGLGIDVAWFEPFDPTDPLLQHPKVLITPHIAGVTDMSYQKMAKVIADTTLEVQAGTSISSIEGIECVN